jgi:predicted MPP superfamily phosphohydrolase
LIVEEAADKMEDVAERLLRVLPDLIFLAVVLLAQTVGTLWILRRFAARASRRARWVIQIAAVLSLASLILGFLLRFARFTKFVPSGFFPGGWLSWGRALVITWALLSMLWLIALAVLPLLPRLRPGHSAARRNFLRAVQAALFGAPAAAIGYGVFIGRFRFQLREQKIEVPGLAHDLDGLRLVQLTDIHLSPFLSRSQLDRAVAMANETRAHIALVTGDLITTGFDPLDDCLQSLAGLRAEAGIFGCMGNHEVYAATERYTEIQGARHGIRFLRNAQAPLRFGDATLNLAGVDYQRYKKPYLQGAESMVVPGAFNVLLSHNPDVFPVAARQGYQLTIGGHTHGGQVRLEILHADLNVARFFTPYVDGLYRLRPVTATGGGLPEGQGSSAIFVSRGIGTIAVPARFGAPPEVALLRLCRT